MRTYYTKPYPTARDVIQDRQYDYISYRIYENGEKKYRNAFKTSRAGAFIPLSDKMWSPWVEICPEDAKVICSEEWSTGEIKKGLTIVVIYDDADSPKDGWPFFANHDIRMNTYAEILCHSGDTFVGDIHDLILSANDNEFGLVILLTPRKEDLLYGAGNLMIPMSFVKSIKRKEEISVP